MKTKTIYDKIKKQNGEAFAKAVRNYDNGIFEVPNIVEIVKYAGRDAEPILPYLTSLKKIKIEEPVEEVCQDPFELLDRAGYDAYFVTNLREQNRIAKYFEESEKLCTFKDHKRYKRYYIINAVRKDVDKIKRADFRGKEERQDAYGTSVLSIQILRKGGFISIKNRYNHAVDNPDNTFFSDPDRIIKGLSAALKKRFNVDFSSQTTALPDGFILFDNQIMCYQYKCNDVYCGADFYIKNGEIHTLDKDKEVMLGYCILNTKHKTLFVPDFYDEPISINKGEYERGEESFIDVLVDELKGRSIRIIKDGNGGHIVLADGAPIVTTKNGNIIALNLPTTKKIGDDFLDGNFSIKAFTAPLLEQVGDCFLYSSVGLQELELPSLKRVQDDFLGGNKALRVLKAPKLRTVGDAFLNLNKAMHTLSLPSLVSVKEGFLANNCILSQLDLPNLEKAGSFFLTCNYVMEQLDLPKLTGVGTYFLMENQRLKVLNVPKLRKIGEGFLFKNKTYKTNAPVLAEKPQFDMNIGINIDEGKKMIDNGIKVISTKKIQNIAQSVQINKTKE